MKTFKAVIVSDDFEDLPDWVANDIQDSGIEFNAKKCRSTDEFLTSAKDADFVWTRGRNEVITEESLPALKNCRAIMRSGSGLDGIPVEAARKLGIKVLNTPEAISEAVAEHAVALLFALIRQIPQHDRAVRNGLWNSEPTWAKWHACRQTLGLVGFGHIARSVQKMLKGFEMETIVFDPFADPELIRKHGAKSVSFEELLKNSDFISLHCPLTESTHHLLGEKEFRMMKPTSLLINTSRGPVVDEKALVPALSEGWIGGAGLDVVEDESPEKDNPLYRLENVIITPHIAAFSDEFSTRFWKASIKVLKKFRDKE